MDTTTFLGAVAEAYARQDVDLSEYCFVLPNRRSCTFFLKRLSERLGGRTMLAPEVMAMGEFMARISGLEVAPRVTQLMELYMAYRELRKVSDPIDDEKTLVDFDEFLPWGEVVLSDFSEVDICDVDAQKIFANVVNYRTLSTNPLTPEQMDILEQFLGYRPTGDESERFWTNVEKGQGSVATSRFTELWQLLPGLYTELRKRLEHPGGDPETALLPMGLAGTVYRRAMELVLDRGLDAIPWKHVVTVGLDWMSMTEIKLFRELRKIGENRKDPVVDFWWDLTGPVLTARDSEAGRIIRRQMRAFPMSRWAQEYVAKAARRDMPDITEVSVPSNSMQTKVIGEWIDPHAGNMAADVADARVAVVLPDENMLLPLLYSLPDRDMDVNVTMGWSMRYTDIATFLFHLQRTLRHRQKEGGDTIYLASDLRMLLAQPIMQLLFGPEVIIRINTDMDRCHRRVMSWTELDGYSKELGRLLYPLSATAGLKESVAWLEELLRNVDFRLSQGEADNKNKVERMLIQVYLTSLFQIAAAGEMNGIEMRSGTLFHILQKMVSGEKISFKGEPLEGLQVMGLLETRALDFDRVIVLSMNDKVMPRHARKRSFIPDTLRYGYGLPSTNHQEKLYDYWFYRLLSRAGRVHLVYDARQSDGMRSGGKSRYLMQLEKIYCRETLKRITMKFSNSARADSAPVPPVEKTPEIRAMLDEFRADHKGDRRYLSASALNTYIRCPLLFYYRYVKNIGDKTESDGGIDAITQGDIFHDAMMNLYFAKKDQHKLWDNASYIPNPQEHDRDYYMRVLNDKDTLRRKMVQAVNRKYHGVKDGPGLDAPLSESVQMVADRLQKQVEAVIRHDADMAAKSPLTVNGVEVAFQDELKVRDDLTVNIKGSLDRVDSLKGGPYRIVDYKTGKVYLDMSKGLDSVFGGGKGDEAKHVFQLLFYARQLEKMTGKRGVDMCIFDTNGMEHGDGECYISLGTNRAGRNSDGEAFAEFDSRLADLIGHIFDDPEFTPASDDAECRYCPMRRLCGKE